MTKEAQLGQNIPKVIETSLQGLAFWVSYDQSLYGNYHINEGALVKEFSTILKAKLNTPFKVTNEGKLSDGNRKRLDIEIVKKGGNNNDKRIAAIEVKLNLASVKKIKGDIDKLAGINEKENILRLS